MGTAGQADSIHTSLTCNVCRSASFRVRGRRRRRCRRLVPGTKSTKAKKIIKMCNGRRCQAALLADFFFKKKMANLNTL